MATRASRVNISPAPSDQSVPWVPILMYHRVVPAIHGSDPYSMCVTTAQFEQQMRFLKERGYRPILLDELAEGRQPGGKRVVITIDDGYRDTFTHAFPILRKYGLSATVFLVSSSLGGPNDWDRDKAKIEDVPLLALSDVREMQRYGISFGSHSVTHRPLPDLTAQEARQEIALSRDSLSESLRVDVTAFSFPFGRSTPALREMVREAGYTAACGIEQRDHSLFNLSRIDVARSNGSWFAWRWKMSGLHFRSRRLPGARRSRGILRAGVRAARSLKRE